MHELGGYESDGQSWVSKRHSSVRGGIRKAGAQNKDSGHNSRIGDDELAKGVLGAV